MPSVTFDPQSTNEQECFEVTIIEDGVYEDDETVVFSCQPCTSEQSSCTSCDGNTTLTIEDGSSESIFICTA